MSVYEDPRIGLSNNNMRTQMEQCSPTSHCVGLALGLDTLSQDHDSSICGS